MLELVVAIAGAIVGSIGTYVVSLLQRSRKLIEYNASSISLLRLNLQTESLISVTVKKSLLTGDKADDGETIPLKSVYGFQINLINSGNVDIDKVDDIEILLNDAAKIVKYETEPTSTEGYKISIQRDVQQKNICHISIPYFNKREQIIARLISTENEDSSCSVKAHGFGIKTRPTGSLSTRRLAILLSIIICYLISLILTIIYVYQTPDTHLFQINPSTIASFAFLFIGVISSFVYIYMYIVSTNKPSYSKSWDWDIPRKKG